MSAPTVVAVPIESLRDGLRVSKGSAFDLLVAVSSGESAIPTELLNGIDWAELIRQARHHSLMPLLAHRLLQSAHANLLPVVVRDRIRSEFQSNLLRNFGLLEEVKRILQALKGRGIEAMPYKGPALAEQVWGSFALRECCDLDFLVRPEDVGRAARVLEEIGYRREMPTPAWLDPALLRNASELQFRHLRANMLLELQWRPAPRTLAVNFDEVQLWRNRNAAELSGITVSTPSPEDLLGLLVIHGWKHNWSKLIWIADVAILAGRYDLDWQQIYRSASRNGWRRILSLGLEMARRVYGAERFPSDVDSGIATLAEELEYKLRATADASYIEWHRNMLRARDSRRLQARQLANFIFTPGLAEYSSYRLPAWGTPAYRFVRLTRVAATMKTKISE
jgi:Uncharacterised nucleotidyltransferase